MADFFHILRRSVSLIVFKSDPEDFEEIHVQQKVRSSVNERKRRHSVNAELCSITTRSFQREGLYVREKAEWNVLLLVTLCSSRGTNLPDIEKTREISCMSCLKLLLLVLFPNADCL
ncbi:hypothetical protein NECAME_05106 [Necator americanus]|uniref:Uncharacterized protein n=1 Tax=Necator americanus TaxID=51031 RepID=W2SJR8_NECAM|nr:hypothetical protein NECAME_05106 [Necator americanus]ETN69783.1 hypothetical protein NECAME_05106 [Necator americanus]